MWGPANGVPEPRSRHLSPYRSDLEGSGVGQRTSNVRRQSMPSHQSGRPHEGRVSRPSGGECQVSGVRRRNLTRYVRGLGHPWWKIRALGSREERLWQLSDGQLPGRIARHVYATVWDKLPSRARERFAREGDVPAVGVRSVSNPTCTEAPSPISVGHHQWKRLTLRLLWRRQWGQWGTILKTIKHLPLPASPRALMWRRLCLRALLGAAWQRQGIILRYLKA